MKLLTVLYDAAIDGSMTELMDELEVKTWTKFFSAQGSGESGPKFGTAIWPGSINQLLVAADEPTVRSIAANVRAMQDEYKLRPGIFMFLQDIEEI